MSLNWKEINLLLEELDMEGCHIQQIFQKDYRNLYFQMYKPGNSFILRICLEQGKTRLHRSEKKPGSKGNQPRFSEFLRSRIRGGRILDLVQNGDDRIVRLTISRGEEITLLYLKLWGNAANILACDEENEILDAAYRRPGRGETIGDHFELPVPGDRLRDYEIREFPADGDFNRFIADEYGRLEREETRTRLAAELRRYYSMRENSLTSRLRRITSASSEEKKADTLRHRGDLILNSTWKISPGDETLICNDYADNDSEVTITLDPSLNPAENAQKYYSDARKLESRKEHLGQERENVRRMLENCRTILDEVAAADVQLSTLFELHRQMKSDSRSRKAAKISETVPGLEFSSGGYRILVGRTAVENETLLRRHTRGNDTWLHTRDYPGGYVFVKHRPGKSIPLEVLLDAGNLALHFSKAKNNGQADMYYTQVKYLRRPKQGKTGLVLPTQEKNLFVKADQQRLNRLLKGEPQ